MSLNLIRSTSEFEVMNIHNLHPEMQNHIPSSYRGMRFFLRRLEALYAGLDSDANTRITAIWQVRKTDGDYKNLKPRIQELLEIVYMRGVLRKLQLAQQVDSRRSLTKHLREEVDRE